MSFLKQGHQEYFRYSYAVTRRLSHVVINNILAPAGHGTARKIHRITTCQEAVLSDFLFFVGGFERDGGSEGRVKDRQRGSERQR